VTMSGHPAEVTFQVGEYVWEGPEEGTQEPLVLRHLSPACTSRGGLYTGHEEPMTGPLPACPSS
jgi:hypothetical protein